MKKNLRTILLASMIVASLSFVACNNKKSSNKNETTSAIETTTNEESSVETITSSVVESTTREEITTIEETTTQSPTTTQTPTTTKQPETTTKPVETTTAKPVVQEPTTLSYADRLRAKINSKEFKELAPTIDYEVWYEDTYLPTLKKTIPAGIYVFGVKECANEIMRAANSHDRNRIDIFENNTKGSDILEGYIDIGYIEYDWLMEHYWSID